jgi:hypothetical protein
MNANPLFFSSGPQQHIFTFCHEMHIVRRGDIRVVKLMYDRKK